MPRPAVRQPDAIGPPAAPMLNLDALNATPLERAPFEFLVVPDFLGPEAVAAAIADFPEIAAPGNHKPEALCYGPAFAALLGELEGGALAACLGAKFGLDLSAYPLTITIRRFCEATDGHIHTDHRTKVVTMLVYLNEGWEAEGGRLRFLRSDHDMEDYAAEATPSGGTMLAFRRSDSSFHGHKPHVGVRRMIQMNWVRRSPLERCEKRLNKLTKPVRRLLNVS